MRYVLPCRAERAKSTMPNPPPTRGGGWSLVPYIMPNGKCEVQDDLDEMRRTEYRRYAHFQDVLRPEFESRGPFEVGGRYWTSLGDGYFEIRFSNRGRIYCTTGPKTVVMYRLRTAKRWRAWLSEDRCFCEQGRADVESGTYDQEHREYLYRKRRNNGLA